MKNKLIIQTLLVGVLVTASFTSCKKDYFDINNNPNDPSDVGVEYLLPSAQAAIGHVLGNNFQIFGGLYAQYWTQSTSASQYKTYEQYNPSSDEFDRPWRALYADALQDLKAIETKATPAQTNYLAISKILQAYTFQLLTDNFGDVPFSEALMGEENTSPKYDSQEQIYDGIITLLNDGIAAIDEETDVHPGSDDLLYGGDMYYWRSFGNTLLLRVYIRMSDVNPTKAQNGIAGLQDAQFIEEGETAQINYGSTGGNTNPLFSSMVDLGYVQNLVASNTAISYMNANNDPRVQVLYEASDLGNYAGIPQGAFDLPTTTDVSYPGIFTGGYANDDASALAPVIFLSSYESLFLRAEAVARGWMTGSAQEYYERAITESFAYTGLDATAASDYYAQTAIAYPAGGSVEDQIKAIITQKWVAMNGTQGDEAWIEWRRTGYPDFFTESTNSLIGSGFPVRLFYPSTEVTQNGSFPGQKQITDRVWWDVD